jgi:hypothetical protein
MTTKQIVDTWLDEVKQDLITNYHKLGLKASGNWERQLETVSKVEGLEIKAIVKGEQYTGAIEYGRRKNRNQSKEAIRAWVGWAGSTFIAQWIKDKGLNLNPFAVSYKIARMGWKVPNAFNVGGLVSDAITDNKIDELIRKLSLFYIDQIKSDMVNTLKYGNNYNTIP